MKEKAKEVSLGLTFETLLIFLKTMQKTRQNNQKESRKTRIAVLWKPRKCFEEEVVINGTNATQCLNKIKTIVKQINGNAETEKNANDSYEKLSRNKATVG